MISHRPVNSGKLSAAGCFMQMDDRWIFLDYIRGSVGRSIGNEYIFYFFGWVID